MGLVSIHGDPVTKDAGVIYPALTHRGIGVQHGAQTHQCQWRNRLSGTRNRVTFVAGMHTPSATAQDVVTSLFTRSGINATGISTKGGGGGSPNWGSHWNDASATWGYTSGPTVIVGEDELICVVVNAGTIEWWINGIQKPTTQTTTTTAINFSNCTQWETGDSGNNNTETVWPHYLYAVYGRALTGNEIAELWRDPFCWLRR